MRPYTIIIMSYYHMGMGKMKFWKRDKIVFDKKIKLKKNSHQILKFCSFYSFYFKDDELGPDSYAFGGTYLCV